MDAAQRMPIGPQGIEAAQHQVQHPVTGRAVDQVCRRAFQCQPSIRRMKPPSMAPLEGKRSAGRRADLRGIRDILKRNIRPFAFRSESHQGIHHPVTRVEDLFGRFALRAIGASLPSALS